MNMATSVTTMSEQDKKVRQFAKASLKAIIRAEASGRVPERFTGTGQEIWQTFRNELTEADLVALAIEDAAVTMPVPFNPSLWWPDWPDWALLNQSADQAEAWIEAAIAQASHSQDAYLRQQAAELEIELPAADTIAALPLPLAHEKWLELPGTAGWVAYSLCIRPNADLYFWENFTVVCATPEEMLLAGLIAWELNTPPRTILPIRLDDHNLTQTSKQGATYQGVVGRRDLHGHRDLRFLQQNGQGVLWV